MGLVFELELLMGVLNPKMSVSSVYSNQRKKNLLRYLVNKIVYSIALVSKHEFRFIMMWRLILDDSTCHTVHPKLTDVL